MKILTLGAAGEIGKMLTNDLLAQTNHELVLYARNAHSRLNAQDESRIKLIDGSFTDFDALVNAMTGVDVIYLNDMNSLEGVTTIVKAMKQTGVKRIIVASILGIYDEVQGNFGQWNTRMVGRNGIQKHKQTAALVEVPEPVYDTH